MRMVPAYTAKRFADAFAREFEAQLVGVQPSNRDWTDRFRRTLRKLGEGRSCEMYPSPTEANGYREGEFLYDFVWLSPKTEVNGTPRLEPATGQIELVAECEWGRRRDIGYDFEKLILAKAPLKFLMYDLGQVSEHALLSEIDIRLQRYACYIVGELYITAGVSWNASTRLVTLRMHFWECTEAGEQSKFPFIRIWQEDRPFVVASTPDSSP